MSATVTAAVPVAAPAPSPSVTAQVVATAATVGAAVLADPTSAVAAVGDAVAIATPGTNGAIRLAAIEDLLARVVSFLHVIHPQDAANHFGTKG